MSVRFALPSRLYVVCDADVCARAGWALVDFASACLDGGATFLQVRAKQASSGRLLEWSSAIVERASPANALVIVNDRADVARLSGAGGVHVGQEDLSPLHVRKVSRADAVVGLSTHTAAQLEASLREPIDYLAVGPVFGTSTKATGYDAIGLAYVERARSRVGRESNPLPVVAIGGITLERAPAVVRAGAASVAVISDLLTTGDPAGRVREFLAALRVVEKAESTEGTD